MLLLPLQVLQQAHRTPTAADAHRKHDRRSRLPFPPPVGTPFFLTPRRRRPQERRRPATRHTLQPTRALPLLPREPAGKFIRLCLPHAGVGLVADSARLSGVSSPSRYRPQLHQLYRHPAGLPLPIFLVQLRHLHRQQSTTVTPYSATPRPPQQLKLVRSRRGRQPYSEDLHHLSQPPHRRPRLSLPLSRLP